jgi:hypothetical protein
MLTYDIIVPENGQPLTLFKLERDHALLWVAVPPWGLNQHMTGATIRASILRFTDKRAILRFPTGRTRCRKLSIYNLFFAGWCAHCERPAYTERARLFCYRCERPCTERVPAHVFPATLRPDFLDTARAFRLMAECYYTLNQARAALRPKLRLAA